MGVDVHQELACDRHGGLELGALGKAKQVQILLEIVCPIKSIRGSISTLNIGPSRNPGCPHRQAQLKGRSEKR